MQTLVSDTASICERRGCLCWFSDAFFCPQHAREGTCARARSTSPDCFQMKLVGLLLMLREEVLAEIIRPVGYSNVVRLCLQVAFPTLLRNRFQFLSALHTQSCFVCHLSFHYISRLRCMLQWLLLQRPQDFLPPADRIIYPYLITVHVYLNTDKVP